MKNRNIVFIVLAFLAVGFAAVSTTLLIAGNTFIGVNTDDFNVYYSKVLVNGVEDTSVVKNERRISFSTTMKSKNETYIIDYDVTNGSKNYDANLKMTCTGGNSYLTVNNQFDTANDLKSSETRSGKLTVTLNKQYTGDELEATIDCTIDVTAVERTDLDNGTPNAPIQFMKWNYIDSDGSGDISVGDEVSLISNPNESFNIVDFDNNTVSMLAKNVLDKNYRQSTSSNSMSFSETADWGSIPGPQELNIQDYDGNAKTYVNEYVSYLRSETSDASLSGNLISLATLFDLGCVSNKDYTYNNDVNYRTCNNSSYTDWLINGKSWWTSSASYNSISKDNRVWCVMTDGSLSSYLYNSQGHYHNIRPVITMSINNLK